jgi:TetR/AcrR family transcriptional regulator, regulator of autoinduction and epiphytic fitness
VKPVNQRDHLSRRERAEQTQARIVEAAHRLFSTQGYEATSMQEIAAKAGVAVQTVYLGFRTKVRLLAAVEQRAVTGQDGEALEPGWLGDLRAAPDGVHALAVFVREAAGTIERIAAFLEMVGSALPADPATTAERERGRDQFFAALVDRLSALGQLRPGLTRVRALDVVRAVVSVDAYIELTRRRGWTEDEWIDWMAGVLAHELLTARAG